MTTLAQIRHAETLLGLVPVRRCEDCHVDISHRGPQAKRCVPCARLRNKVQQAEWSRRQQAEHAASIRRSRLQGELLEMLDRRPTLGMAARELGIPLAEAQLLLRSSFPDNRPYRQEAA